MNLTRTTMAMLAVMATVAVFGSSSLAFSSYDGGTYAGSWTVSIGDAVGTIAISDDTSIDDLRDQAISREDAVEGYDNVIKSKLTKAVNDSDEYYLVWKVVEAAESDMYIMHILDAGTGEPLVDPVIKEGGMCGGAKTS